MEMKPVKELNFGFSDSENYKRKENRAQFNQIFLPTSQLEQIFLPSTYFLMGEKGTGKTASAVYITNNYSKETVSLLRYIRETEYDKFVTLKRRQHFDLSDYTNIWKIIIYVLITQQISERETKVPIFGNTGKFSALIKAMSEYSQNAFSPEINYAIQFVEEANLSAELIAKYTGLEATLGGNEKVSISFSEQRFSTNLRFIQNNFEDALKKIKLSQNHVLFIDGIDIRPSSIPYSDYLECVKGLANAIWSVNNDLFANIKDSRGRIKAILLVRPDIFNSLGLQNQNSKIRDNSVVLSWLTTENDFRQSALFALADKILSHQQTTTPPLSIAWNYYFPYISSFVTFLKYSLYRPRDILTILAIQKENFLQENRSDKDVFRASDFYNPAFTRKYSDYMLGEVKDHLAFYYSNEDYESFVKFFQFLNGKSRFSYEDFLAAFRAYSEFLRRNVKSKPSFAETPDIFLQLLYDLNAISYISKTDDKPFYGWCYRERTPANIAPKVRTHARYEVHVGLMKALDLGKHFR